MALEEYRKKRQFTETPEPAGRVWRASRKQIFVVQKHAASRLHYDFRLAINGVLVSWAVPKGPSMNPADKRLAVRTEDHPLEYVDFEGTIPEGQYGAGTVMVWDRGTYEPQDSSVTPGEQLAHGEINAVLRGAKLRGGFTLVRTGKPSAGARQKERWLLIKHRDEYADPSWNIESPRFARSVLTDRTLKQIEQDRPEKSPSLGGCAADSAWERISHMPSVSTGKRRDQREPETDTARDPVLEADIESFPASDPPAWIPARIGPASAVVPDVKKSGTARRRRKKPSK
jgi:bifunctional non-homologous end joining protein LigD